MTRHKKTIYIFTCAAAVIIFMTLLRGPLHRFIQDKLYDNAPSGASCESLLIKSDVERILARKAELVARIQSVGEQPGDVTVGLGTLCDDQKAEILILYGGHQQRLQIEEILRSDNFDGVPVSLKNV